MSTATISPPESTSSRADNSASPYFGEAASELAINGGPKTVQAKFQEKWKTSHVKDLMPMMRHLVRGRNTMITGSMLNGFENRFASLCGTRYGLMMNSGTASLHSAYFAAGIGPGDEVIVPTYTWFATAAPILQCGAKPVFCDIDEKTLTACPEDAERRITERTKAICVVHVWGNPAAMDRFVDLARRHNLVLIEDASHAHGATYQGKPIGGWGDIGCFSLQGSKAVSGGEAGIAVTNNPDYFDCMLALGHNGRQEDHVTGKYDVDQMNLGIKYRPHIAAIALASGGLKRLPQLNQLRRRNYAIMAEELADCPAVRPIETYESAERGGLLEYIFRFVPEEAGGWTRETFVAAAQAEGAKVNPDRYTQMSASGRLLHESPMFNLVHEQGWGGPLRNIPYDTLPRDEHFPTAERLADELVTIPPFTMVDEDYIHQTARAMKKVAETARNMG